MYLAAALAAHNVVSPRPMPVPGPSLPSLSENATATFMDGSALDSDDDIPTPSLTSTASFCSSDRSSSFDLHPFNSNLSSSIYSTSSAQSPIGAFFTPNPTAKVRKNEHLAVLLPKNLWKPDSQAACCEIIPCRRKFTMLERKHHCRKCGGVFCGSCSSRTTTLLDTANRDFLHPPRRVPISTFASPQSPVVQARVCDDCYIQIHGCDEIANGSEYVNARRDSNPSSPCTPRTPSSCRSMRRMHSSSSIPPRQRRQRTISESQSSAPPSVRSSSSEESSLGDLGYYPLRVHSSVCKATGGGRWTPRPVRQWDGHRIPGGKAPYEVAMERAAEKERTRKVNPLIRDGEFQLRQPRAPERVDRWKPTEVCAH